MKRAHTVEVCYYVFYFNEASVLIKVLTFTCFTIEMSKLMVIVGNIVIPKKKSKNASFELPKTPLKQGMFKPTGMQSSSSRKGVKIS